MTISQTATSIENGSEIGASGQLREARFMEKLETQGMSMKMEFTSRMATNGEMWRWNSTWWRLLQATNILVHFCEHKTRAFPVQLVGGSSTGHFTHSAPRGPFRTTRTGVESTIPTYLSPFNSTRGSTLSIKWLETRFLNGQMENWYRTIFKLKKLGWYPREHWVLVVMKTVGV